MFCGRPKIPLPMVEPTTNATRRPRPRVPRVRAVVGSTRIGSSTGIFEGVMIIFFFLENSAHTDKLKRMKVLSIYYIETPPRPHPSTGE
jgi:hypothetical protein